MPEVRSAFAACAVESDTFVFGGYNYGADHANVFKYDTVADTWRILAPMPRSCDNNCASVLGGLDFIFGTTYDKEVLRFDSVSGVWSEIARTRERHGYVCSSFVLEGSLHVVGGSEHYSSVECYDVTKDAWAPVADMLEAGRCSLRAVTVEFADLAEEQDLLDSLIAQAGEREVL
jgi:hypothetical protein